MPASANGNPGPPPDDLPSRSAAWAVGAAFLALLMAAIGRVVSAARGLWHPLSLADDAYYYIVIAKHVVRGAGFSFDGFEPTNGFHPLWMAVTVAVLWLVGVESSLRLQVAVYTVVAMLPLLIGAAICAREVLRPRGAGDTRALAFLGVLLALGLPETAYVCMAGVESGLLVCLLILLLRSYLLEQSGGLAVLFPLVFLTRLDAPLWLAPLLLHEAVRVRNGRRIAVLLLPLAVSMAGLGAFNVITTGGVLPIHALLTSTFPVPSPKWHLITERLAQGPRAFTYANLCSLLAAAGVVSGLWVRARRRSRAEGEVWVLVLIAAGAVSLLLLLFFRKWMEQPAIWHFTPGVIFRLFRVSGGSGHGYS